MKIITLLAGAIAMLFLSCNSQGNKLNTGNGDADSVNIEDSVPECAEEYFEDAEGEMADDEDTDKWYIKTDFGPKLDSIFALYDALPYPDNANAVDSLKMTVVYPAPDISLIYNGEEEKVLAEQVRDIYCDVLESGNYLTNVSKDTNFIELYCTKDFCQFIDFAYENECPPGVDPFTDAQDHNTSHLHQVKVTNLQGDKALASVTFGILNREGVSLMTMNLKMRKENGAWRINDFIYVISYVESLIREMESLGVDVPEKYHKFIQ